MHLRTSTRALPTHPALSPQYVDQAFSKEAPAVMQGWTSTSRRINTHLQPVAEERADDGAIGLHWGLGGATQKWT